MKGGECSMAETPVPVEEWIKKRILALKSLLAEKRHLLLVTSQTVQQLEGAIAELETLQKQLLPTDQQKS